MIDYNDGKWHGWNGGECPVHEEMIGDLTYWDGVTYTGVRMVQFDWSIPMLFRVTKPYTEPREGYAVTLFRTAREAKVAHPGCNPVFVREVSDV